VGVDLLAGGVPCPPFTIAGKQLGASDERDLFAWAIELCATVQPRALLLENVRGLSLPRFAGYRQHVLDRLASSGTRPTGGCCRRLTVGDRRSAIGLDNEALPVQF
jgi:site-specific DNA-cytosine methylase